MASYASVEHLKQLNGWQVLFEEHPLDRNIPLYPEFARERTSKDKKLLSIEVSVWSEGLCSSRKVLSVEAEENTTLLALRYSSDPKASFNSPRSIY